MPASHDRAQRIAEYIRQDPLAAKLGACFEEIRPGYSRVALTVTPDMVNFHGITHGGLVFALADMAFAAAGNSHGQIAVALNVDIAFLKAAMPGDRLVAEAQETQDGGRTALYAISVREAGRGDLIASLQALVYRRKQWFVPPA